ncbi:hypothetical protein PRIPAC_90815 [Pristionchus pacificus]|uniref:G protein-coupled receptor n=1 Tax=Pristionchus pacificus TaxID=54126 RepID=A0A2A6CTP3_PRIPA|nr:hypothetical protein PRIPAC_90815 [Pristionchus pacificus]|eukprot:PDM81456.1 G protein-coupled receptor [Pristionchus pacificus]
MQFAALFKWYCIGACAISMIFNALLIFIANKRKEKVGFYRFFTQVTVLIGVLYSLGFAIAQPLWYAGPGMLGFFSIAPWSNCEMSIKIAFQVWFASFMLIILIMTISFMYRYGLLCSPRIVSWFEIPRRVAVTICFLTMFCFGWMYNSNFLLFAESKEVRQQMQTKFSAEYEVDLMISYVLTDNGSANRSITATLLLTTAMQLQIVIMFFCGWKIHKTIKIQTLSERLKRMHGRTLTMMIAQILAMLFDLFPIFNPIIVIYFTEDYKRFLLRKGSSIIQWYCIGACAISMIFNALLIFIANKRKEKVGFYRFFTQATELIGVLYSLGFAIEQPFWYAGPGMLGFFSIAPWSNEEMAIKIAFQIWFTSFVLIVLIMTNSFMYRYGLLCSSRVVSWFEVPRRMAVTMCFLTMVCCGWMYNSNFLLFAESKEVRMQMHAKFSTDYEVDLMTSYVLTVNINDNALAIRSITATLLLTVVMQIQIVIMSVCGWKIHKTIKIQTLSNKLKRLHGRALRIMTAQVLNPVMFLYIPSFINLLGMFVDSDFGDFPKASIILAMSLDLFPIFNPIIVIFFTEEYKRYLLRQGSSIVQISYSKSRDQISVKKTRST